MKKGILFVLTFTIALGTTQVGFAGNKCGGCLKRTGEVAEKYVVPALRIAGALIPNDEAKLVINGILTVHDAAGGLYDGDVKQQDVIAVLQAAAAAGRIEISEQNEKIVGILVKAGLMAFDGSVNDAVRHLTPHVLAELAKQAATHRGAPQEPVARNVQVVNMFDAVRSREGVEEAHIEA